MQGLLTTHQFVNWTLKKLPLIDKGKEAERVQSSLNAEVDRLKTVSANSDNKIKQLEREISKLKKDHASDLKAKDDLLQQKVDAAVKAALEDASEQIIAEYKASPQFMAFSFEYLERGVKATGRWAAMKEKEVGKLTSSDFVDLSFADPQFSQALEELENEAKGAAPAETAPLEVSETTSAHHEGDAEVANVGHHDQSEGITPAVSGP